MIEFIGFKTKRKAKKYQKKHGGLLCWREKTTKKRKGVDIFYGYAIIYGLDFEKYPFAVLKV